MTGGLYSFNMQTIPTPILCFGVDSMPPETRVTEEDELRVTEEGETRATEDE